jgi:hypothetical protein
MSIINRLVIKYCQVASVASGGIFLANMIHRYKHRPPTSIRKMTPFKWVGEKLSDSYDFTYNIGLKSLSLGAIWPLTAWEYAYRYKNDLHYAELYYPFYDRLEYQKKQNIIRIRKSQI